MTTIIGSAAGGPWNTNGAWVGGVQPTAADDAQFDATTGSISASAGTPVCRSLDMTGYTGTFSGATGVGIGDATAGLSNIALKLAGTITYTGIFTLKSTSATEQTVTTAGNTGFQIVFSGLGGKWKPTDALNTPTKALQGTAGTWNFNGQQHDVLQLTCSGGSAKAFTDSGLATVLNTYSTASNFTISSGTPTLTLTNTTWTIMDTTAASKTFTFLASQNVAIYALRLAGGGQFSLISNSTLTLSTPPIIITPVAGQIVQFLSGSVVVLPAGCTGFFDGSSANPPTIRSSNTPTPFNVSCPSGIVTANNVKLKDSAATGGATFKATNAVDNTGNTGWIFLMGMWPITA